MVTSTFSCMFNANLLKLIEAGHFIGGSSSKPISLGKTDSSYEDEDLKLVRIQYN